MSRKPKLTFFYETSCGHLTVAFTAGEFPCQVCRKLAIITDVHVYEWHAYCTHKTGLDKVCRFSSWHGTSEIFAHMDSARHFRNTSHMETRYILQARPEAVKHRDQLVKDVLLPSLHEVAQWRKQNGESNSTAT
jgi:hypothetical protein